jgi:hypothetical protein
MNGTASLLTVFSNLFEGIPNEGAGSSQDDR